MRGPMIPVAIALILGTLVGSLTRMSATVFLVVSVSTTLAAAAAMTRRRFHVLAKLAAFLAIVTLAGWHAHQTFYTIAPDSIARYVGLDATLATVRGRAVSTPQTSYIADDLPGYQRPPGSTFLLDVDEIRTREGWRSTRGKLRVMIDEAPSPVRAGDRVELAGWLRPWSRPMNPGQFDSSHYARIHRIDGQLSLPAVAGATVLDEVHWTGRMRHALWSLRNAARSRLIGVDDGFDGDLLTALIFGDRAPSLNPLSDAMVDVGVAQFLSISGLHLGILLGFVYLICRLCMLSSSRSAMVVLIVLSVYLLLAEPRPALLRSGIMAATLAMAVVARRKVSMLNALAVACVVLLMFRPGQLFQPGFQLSFGIVAGIILLARPIEQRLFQRFLKFRGLKVFRYEHRWQRWVNFTLANTLMTTVSMSLAAMVVALPLVWCYFGVVTPYAPLLVIMLTPLLAGTLVLGYLSLVVSPWIPSIGGVLALLSGAVARGLALSIELAGRLPGAVLRMRPVGWEWVLLYAATVTCLILNRRRPARLVLSVILVGTLAWLTFDTQRPIPPDGAAELHVLAIGNGQCALLRLPTGPTVLFDAGTQSGSDVSTALDAFLASTRRPAPRIAFVSHANTDHYNGLLTLARRGQLTRVYMNPHFGRGDLFPGDRDARQFVELLKTHGIEIVHLIAGDEVQLDEKTTVRVLWPPRDVLLSTEPNNRSLILLVDTLGRRVLFTGDIQADTQARLVDANTALACEILLLPHHGAWNDSLPALVEASDPGIVIQSTGRQTRTMGIADDRNAFFDGLRARRSFRVTGADGYVGVRWTPDTIALTPRRDDLLMSED